MRDGARRDANAADEGAVGAPLVEQDEVRPLGAQRRVPVAHAGVGQPHVAAGAASEDDALPSVERQARLSLPVAERTRTVMGMEEAGSARRDAVQRAGSR